MERIKGLVVAGLTPFDQNGDLKLEAIPPLVERLLDQGVAGFYVCGSTGEGVSLSVEERMRVTEAYTRAVAGCAPVIAQVGHNALVDARELARHAQAVGVDAISANAPSYFKVTKVETLLESMALITEGAPELPFYYYHIPALTGAAIDMPTFMARAIDVIPSLAGLKYTEPDAATYQACVRMFPDKQIFWGCDEMLLSAMVVGAEAAVGSTYNLMAPIYLRMIERFEAGDLTAAADLQWSAAEIIRVILRYPLHPSIKAILETMGHDFGACRPPQNRLETAQRDGLLAELHSLGFFEPLEAPRAQCG